MTRLDFLYVDCSNNSWTCLTLDLKSWPVSKYELNVGSRFLFRFFMK